MSGGVWIWRGNEQRPGKEAAAGRQTAPVDGLSELQELEPETEQAAVLLWPCSVMRSNRLQHANGAALLQREQDTLPSGQPLLERAKLPDGAWLLNAGAARIAELDEPALATRLRAAGIGWRALQEKEPATESVRAGCRFYRVAVFHLEIVQMERIGVPLLGGGYSADTASWRPAGLSAAGAGYGRRADVRAGLDETDPLYRRVARMAMRALYALCLDFGEVIVALDDDGRTSVSAVKLPPHGSSVWQEAAARFALTYPAEEAARGSVLLGADPEFALLRPDGRLASAARYLPPHGPVGCDAVPVGRRLRYPVAELRPAPAADPAALASALRSLLLQASQRIGASGLRWLAGGMPVPGLALGGHLHLSGVPLTSRLLRTLDSCVALPLALVEGAGARTRRPRYGWLGDFRRQPHGGFEYRTPPSWLVSPAAARAAFALALLAAAEERTLAATPHVLPACDEALVAAYYAGDRRTLLRGLEPFFARLALTRSYARLARWIEPLLEAARRGDVWDEGRDIRLKWRIPVR